MALETANRASGAPERHPRSILILGGNYGQLPLIGAARAEGYRIVLVDWSGSHPGVQLADVYHPCSYLERDRVLEIAREEGISGVFSNSEFAALEVAVVFAKQWDLA